MEVWEVNVGTCFQERVILSSNRHPTDIQPTTPTCPGEAVPEKECMGGVRVRPTAAPEPLVSDVEEVGQLFEREDERVVVLEQHLSGDA